MLAKRLSSLPPAAWGALGASVLILALLLFSVFQGLRRSDGEDRWEAWQTIKSALVFLAGPFPISIAIHLAVLFFLIHEVTQVVAPRLIHIRLESGGGGTGGASPDVKLPTLPDIATPNT